MPSPQTSPPACPPADQVLGYLNFSSGAPDPQFLANLDRLFEDVGATAVRPIWQGVAQRLRERLQQLQATNSAFRDTAQAEAALRLVFERGLSAYREFHRDLLFHQTDEGLFRSFFVGRFFEAVLRQGPPWDEEERILSGALRLLNDYVGYRPVAVLEKQKLEAYPHEFLRPIPLYVRGAGVAFGPEREVVTQALAILQSTDSDLLGQACFHFELLDELALDPRAYDFDHPANKRPNHHFGQWDSRHLDGQGRYRRFVVQQVTLDALMSRIDECPDLPREELVLEAAAVLAGTILMASGICGDSPMTYDSGMSLSKLLPRIARYRDEFYERLLARMQGAHGKRLRSEARQRRQPFGSARQHLNAYLARRRASQLEHVHLARLFARMGHFEAARQEADVVPCASARMQCQMDCLMTRAQTACERGQLAEAAAVLPQVVEVLKRAIGCGAVIDPWNILGFDAQFSLFPSLENSVRDHRADELVARMDRLWALYSRVWSEAAAAADRQVSQQVSRQFHETARWWHQFAVHEVSSVEAADALAVYRAAQRVAQTMQVWQQGGAAVGDVAFWAPHAAMFDSAEAYALVIEGLLRRGDTVATRALLIHWLSQAEVVGLGHEERSWHQWVRRWLAQVLAPTAGEFPAAEAPWPQAAEELPSPQPQAWETLQKFLDYLEANAESYWTVPRFALGPSGAEGGAASAEDEEAPSPFASAYDGVVYRDSTDDGIDGSVFEAGEDTADELTQESKRLSQRMAFLATVAQLWIQAATHPALRLPPEADDGCRAARAAALRRWWQQAERHRAGIAELMAAVRSYRIPPPTPDHDALVEYDRQRVVLESLLESIMSVAIDMAQASHLLVAALVRIEPQTPVRGELATLVPIQAALLEGDRARVLALLPPLLTHLASQPLLYVPLSKGGHPHTIVEVRLRQQLLQNLLRWMPRLGLWSATCRLLQVAQQMERDHPAGPGAVTEFDELFKIGFRALVEHLVLSARQWGEGVRGGERQPEALVSCLELLTQRLLAGWLAHSRTLRLSVLERLHDKESWRQVQAFIERYGDELFTQRFLNLANLRAILHQGTGRWLASVQEDPRDDPPQRLLDDLAQGRISQASAAESLALVLEAIVENYGEYRDYNSTTTQSDRGELLYMLLDFLRLRCRYDRVCWNMRPVVLAHEVLVRYGQEEAARIWRRALADRTQDEARHYLTKLAELQAKYAMRMPTVADRIAERFIRPLTIDRIRALIAPAMAEARRGGPTPQFDLLREETALLTREPTGVGLDLPAWLVALEEEVDEALAAQQHGPAREDLARAVPCRLLSYEQALAELECEEDPHLPRR